MDHDYIEVTVIDEGKGGYIKSGFSKQCPETREGEYPGNFNGSLGYKSYEKEIKDNGNKIKKIEGTDDTYCFCIM